MNVLAFETLTFPQLVAEWPNIRPLLDRAVLHGRGEVVVDDVLSLAAQDRMFVSVLREDRKITLALAAEVIQFPRCKALNLAFAGGAGAKTISEVFFDQLRAMGKDRGADRVQCYCRPSVARMLKKLRPTAEEAYVVLEEVL